MEVQLILEIKEKIIINGILIKKIHIELTNEGNINITLKGDNNVR